MVKHIFWVAFLCVSGTVIAEERLLTSSFMSQIPNVSILQNLELSNKRYANIPQDGTRSVGVLWGQTEHGADKFWVVGVGGGKDLILQGGGIKREGAVYRGVIDLHDLGITGQSIAVDVCINPDKETLIYRVVDRPGSKISAGAELPDFSVQQLDGSVARLSNFRGRPVVLNWWATTCAPCVAEIPGLNRLVNTYDGRVAFLAVAWNQPEDVHAFLKAHPFAYQQAISNGETEAIFGNSLPRNVIVDANGVVVFDETGGHIHKYRELDSVLESLVQTN